MKIYTKKSIVLEAMGKDKKDTKYLDRAIERGEVIEIEDEKECTYYAIKEQFMDSLIVNYESRVRKLQEKADSSEELKERAYEAEENVRYYEKENENLSKKNSKLESVLESLREKGMDIGYGA